MTEINLAGLVRGLEWHDKDAPMEMRSVCGNYWAHPTGAWRPSDESYRNVTGIQTLEAARYACNAHHVTATLAALNLGPLEALVKAADGLKRDMEERAQVNVDVIAGKEYRIVNAGNSAWTGFCTALAAITGETK